MAPHHFASEYFIQITSRLNAVTSDAMVKFQSNFDSKAEGNHA